MPHRTATVGHGNVAQATDPVAGQNFHDAQG
jgi:hypothetical protein